MLNKEKYAKEIIEALVQNNGNGVGVVKGKPASCGLVECETCDICDNCGDGFVEWANSEYVEPPVDWSKVAVDTPIYVRDSDKKSGEGGTLRNTKITISMLMLTEQRHGVQIGTQLFGNMPNLRRRCRNED